MLNIILCDDDQFILQLSKEKITDAIKENHLPAQISCISTDVKEMFRYLEANEGENKFLLFIDLDFGDGKLNGIDAVKQAKRINSQIKAVFVTNHHEMAMQVLGSGVEPFGFIEKTTDMKKLSSGYEKYIQMTLRYFSNEDDDKNYVTLIVGIDEDIKVPKSHILYIESEKTVSHGVSYHTIDGSCITVRDTIDNCCKELGDMFIRVHRSILANKKYIVSQNGAFLRLSTGTEIPCAVRMRGEVKKCLKH